MSRLTLANIWAMRWLIVGGAFALVGLFTDNLRTLIFGLWLVTMFRIDLSEQKTELVVLQAETRLTHLVYWGRQ